MFFADPIQTISLELPAGWVYGPFDSTLTDFYFSRWDHPEQLIAVHVRPTSVAQDQPHENWIGRIRSEIGERGSLDEISAQEGAAVFAEFGYGQGAQRVAFIRGALVELVVEQRGLDSESHSPWLPFETAIKTVSSEVNRSAPQVPGADEFNASVQAANEAFERKDYAAVAVSLKQAITIGTSAWLYSLAPAANSPEILAAVRVAQAMSHLGYLTGEPSLPRDAEALLLRAQCTLEQMEPLPESAQQMKTEISEMLQNISSETKKGTEAGNPGNISPILSIRERGIRLAQDAAKAFEVDDPDDACRLSGMAIEDLLSLISFLRRGHSEEVPDEIANQLAGQGITDPEDQKHAMKRAREALLYSPLNQSLQIRSSCAAELRNPAALEAAEMLVQVARLIAEADPNDSSTILNRALARINFACALMMSSDEADLDEAEKWFDSAALIAESMGDKTPSSGRWIPSCELQLKMILRVIDRQMSEAKENSSRLQRLRSKFDAIAAQIRIKLPAK